MNLRISGKQIDIGNALREHVDGRVADGVAKYFDRPFEGHVVFSKEGSGFRADCVVHLATGLMAQAQGTDPGDIYACFDKAAERLEKQIRRYKRRLKDHHSQNSAAEQLAAANTMISAEEESSNEFETLDPVVIAETQTDVWELTVREAVIRLELAGGPALMFRNAGHGGLNMIYRRPDGNIGWVDPSDNQQS